jgi:hypothetical protein
MRKLPFAHRIIRPKDYVPSVATDIRKTIAKERARLAEEAKAKTPAKPTKVQPLRKAAK